MGRDGNGRAQKVVEGRRWAGMVMEGHKRFLKGAGGQGW